MAELVAPMIWLLVVAYILIGLIISYAIGRWLHTTDIDAMMFGTFWGLVAIVSPFLLVFFLFSKASDMGNRRRNQ